MKGEDIIFFDNFCSLILSVPFTHVAPLQAASQKQYIPAHNPLDMIPKHKTRCAWYPKCLRTITLCKGKRKELCVYFKHKIHDNDFIAEMLAEKNELRKQRDRERKKWSAKIRKESNQIHKRMLIYIYKFQTFSSH